MVPHPPANVTPLASEAVTGSPRKWRWLTWVGIISVIMFVYVLSEPLVIKCRKNVPLTEAINNARQIGLALLEFESDDEHFPDEKTIVQVKAKHPTDLSLGTKTSNDFFRQLFAAGNVSTERIFYAKLKGATLPDDIITAGEALKKGECGFTYLSGLSSRGNPSRPLLVTPLIPGTDRFDPEPFQGKAVLLRMDNSVSSISIREDGHVWVDGMNLLDPTHPIWEGKPPVIAWPE